MHVSIFRYIVCLYECKYLYTHCIYLYAYKSLSVSMCLTCQCGHIDDDQTAVQSCCLYVSVWLCVGVSACQCVSVCA